MYNESKGFTADFLFGEEYAPRKTNLPGRFLGLALSGLCDVQNFIRELVKAAAKHGIILRKVTRDYDSTRAAWSRNDLHFEGWFQSYPS